MNRFEIEGTVKYDAKGISVKLETDVREGRKYGEIIEVMCFKKEHNDVKAGTRIKITGHVEPKKTEYARKYNDKEYPVYINRLVAEVVEELF